MIVADAYGYEKTLEKDVYCTCTVGLLVLSGVDSQEVFSKVHNLC